MTDTNRRVRQVAISHDDRRRHSYPYATRRDDDDSTLSTVAAVIAAESLLNFNDPASPTDTPSFGGFDGGESGGAGASGSWDSSSSIDSSSSSTDSSSSYDSGSSSGGDF